MNRLRLSTLGGIRRCVECGEPTSAPRDYDTPAMCDQCADETEADLDAVHAWQAQAGAQFLGAERGTRGRT